MPLANLATLSCRRRK